MYLHSTECLQNIITMTWMFLRHKGTRMIEDDVPYWAYKCLKNFCLTCFLIYVHLLWCIYLQRLKLCTCHQTLSHFL